MKGAAINALAIIAGASCGLLLKNAVPERYKQTIMQSLGLVVFLIGLKMALDIENILIAVISLAVGSYLGELLNIDMHLNNLAKTMTIRFGDKYGDFGKGFITATLVFGIGAMAIVGSIQEGLSGDASIIYAKSTIDGIAAIIFSATLGVGVALSAIPIFLYQSAIAITASFFGNMVSETLVRELTGVGGILILAIGMSMLDIAKIKVANLLPSMIIVIILVIANF